MVFYYKSYRTKSLLFIIFIGLLLIRLTIITYPIPNQFEAKIIKINENYVIGKTKGIKILIYTDKALNYDEKISFSGEYSEISQPASKYSFSFSNFMLNNNVKYSIKAKNVKIVSQKQTLRSRLYKKVNMHKDYLILNKIFFGINNSEIDFNIIFLMSSAGVIIKSLIAIIKKILNKFMYKKTTDIIEILLLCFFMVVFKHYLFYLNYLFFILLKKMKFNNADATFLAASIILLFNPLYMFSISFVVNLAFRITNIISLKNNMRFIESLFVILPIQLRLFYKANIFQIIFYRYYKLTAIAVYCLAVFDIFLKTSLTKSFLTIIDLKFPLLTISGHMPNILLIFWLFFGLLMLSRTNHLYKFIMLLIIVANQNQMLFNPSLVYTQLYVGQGDAAIIRYPFKKQVLFIDTGPPTAKNKLDAYLNYYGIKTIHTIIISHDDLDHSGNCQHLLDNYQVNNFVETMQTTNFYNLKLNSVNYQVGDDNDQSLITFFKVNNYTYLSLGDISKSVEKIFLKQYVGINPNIIKLAHHGSNTSSSDQLLSQKSVKLLLNSSGRNNMYKHPNHFVLKRILKYQLPFIDTQLVGDIEIYHFFGYNFITY